MALARLGLRVFSGPREPLLSGRSLGRYGLKGAVISFTVSSVGASRIAQRCRGAALDPGFPGLPLRASAGAWTQAPQGRSIPLCHWCNLGLASFLA